MHTAKKHSSIVNLLGIALMATFLTSEDSWAGRVDGRQYRQRQRIEHGISSGELTSREVRRLEHQQARIRRAEVRANRDGQVTSREQARIERMQDRASYNLYRKNHNWRDNQ